MPRVPTYDNFQVNQNTLPQTQLTIPNAPTMPDVAGQQAQQMGQAMQQAGGKLGQVALAMQQEVNQLRIDDALNQVKEHALKMTYDKDVGFTNLRGVAALERPDGKPLEQEYGETLQQRISEIAGGLGNDAQRAAFSRAATGILSNFRGQLVKHEADEFRTYALSKTEGIQATALREIQLSWSNPEAIDAAVTRIKAQTYRQAQLLGKSAEWQEMQARKMTSTAHATALSAALENNDVLYADGYLKKYASQMEADDILKVRGAITKTMDLQVGMNIGSEVLAQNAPQLVPSDYARLTNIVMGIESNGRRYGADGQILQGPQTRYGTAKGEMQVLDGTNKDPGFGVRPAQDDSPEERARVGRDYLRAMVQRYNGEIDKTLAAYNWGPGNVDAAIKEHGENWLAKAPKETRDYVARGAQEFGAGAGKPPKPTLAQLKAELRTRPELAGNPARLKYAEDRLEADYKAMNDAIKQREDEALDTAYKQLYSNGGDFSKLPANLRAAIPGDKMGAVMTFARQIAKDGTTVHQSEKWAEILSLPREALTSMTPIEFYRQYRPVLDDAHLEKGYALLNEAKGVSDEKHLEIITTAQRIKQSAINAKILPATDKPDEKQQKKFAQFNQLIDDRVRQFERIDLGGKRKANSEELQKIIDHTLMDQAFVSVDYWLDSGPAPVGLMSPEEQDKAYVKVGDESIMLSSIPADQRATITSKLKARGKAVTEQAIADLWVRAGIPK